MTNPIADFNVRRMFMDSDDAPEQADVIYYALIDSGEDVAIEQCLELPNASEVIQWLRANGYPEFAQ